MREAIKTIQISIGKKQLIIFGIVIMAAVLGVLIWKFNLYTKAYAAIFKAEVQITVVDSADNTKLLSPEITLVNTEKGAYKGTVTADEQGNATFTKLIKGSYRIEAKLSGYDDYSGTVNLLRGKKNTYQFAMVKTPPTTSVFSGTVKNWVTGVGVEGVSLTLNGEKTTSDKEGNFNFASVVTGEYDVALSASGYLNKTQKVTIAKDNPAQEITLVPQGKVVFVSNKDRGKRGIYTANYDGSDSKYLIERKGETEDYNPIFSPDQKKVVFLSTRDGVKENNEDRASLYIVDIDGKNLNKIADYLSYDLPSWSTDSKKVIYTLSKRNESNNTKYSAAIYDVSDKQSKAIFSDETSSRWRLNQSGTKVAYVLGLDAAKIYVYDIASSSATMVTEETVQVTLASFKGDDSLIYNYWKDNKTTYISVNINTAAKSEITYEYPRRNEVKSPNGKLIAYIENRDGKSNIYSANIDGKGEKQLSTNNTAVSEPYWSTDSKYLFFSSRTTGESALYVVGVGGGSEKKVVDINLDGHGGPGMQ